MRKLLAIECILGLFLVALGLVPMWLGQHANGSMFLFGASARRWIGYVVLLIASITSVAPSDGLPLQVILSFGTSFLRSKLPLIGIFALAASLCFSWIQMAGGVDALANLVASVVFGSWLLPLLPVLLVARSIVHRLNKGGDEENGPKVAIYFAMAFSLSVEAMVFSVAQIRAADFRNQLKSDITNNPVAHVHDIKWIDDEGLIDDLAFSPDNRRLATIGSFYGGAVLKTWNLMVPGLPETSRTITGLRKQEASAIALAFSADGEKLAVAYNDGGLEIRDSKDPSRILDQRRISIDHLFSSTIKHGAFAPGGDVLLLGGWIVRPFEKSENLKLPRCPGVEWMPREAQASAVSSTRVVIVKTVFKKGVEGNVFEGFAWTRAGAVSCKEVPKRIALSAPSYQFRDWDRPPEIQAVLSPDDEFMAFGLPGGIAVVQSTSNDTALRRWFPGGADSRTETTPVAFSSKGTFGVAYHKTLTLYKNGMSGDGKKFPIPFPARRLLFSSDGRILLVAGESRVQLFDTATESWLGSLRSSVMSRWIDFHTSFLELE